MRRWRALGALFAGLVCFAGAAALAADEPDAFERGRSAFHRGDFGSAAAEWSRAVAEARAQGDEQGALRASLRRAEALQLLGDFGLALETLDQAVAAARASGAGPATRAALRGARGSLYLTVARPEDARAELEAARALAEEAGDRATLASLSNDLGLVYATQGDYETAVARFVDSERRAAELEDLELAARALCNVVRAYADSGEARATRGGVERARLRVERLPPEREKSRLLLHLARSLDRLRALPETSVEARASDLIAMRALLGEAEEIAARTRDPRTSSYALGYMAELYAAQDRAAEALELNRRAVEAARSANADEIRYRWHARSAELLETLGRRDEAIAEYRVAVDLLEGVRHAMALEAGRPAASFRDRVGGVYFGYVDLLLRRAAEKADPAPDLRRAQQTLEQLKAAELRDYYQDECVDNARRSQVSAAEASPSAAIIYPVLLADRVEILVSTKSRTWRRAVPIGRAEATAQLHRLRMLLEQRTTREYLRPAREVFDWLMRPLLEDLEMAGVDSLVFVPDGALRSVPMAALHDGDRFLIERFAIAITPGLSLTDPRPLDREGIRLFAGGVSDAVQGFSALPHVEDELSRLAELYDGRVLLNEDFQRPRVEQELGGGAFSIVHIASHASFDSEAENTYVLTHEGKLSMDDLASFVGLFRFRDQPLDLLMLSACESAAGDERAALGLSGLAVKAGARSAAGTLWSVNDEAASRLVAHFYETLKTPGISRAEALRRAQRELLETPKFAHPAYWAAFILISNWL